MGRTADAAHQRGESPMASCTLGLSPVSRQSYHHTWPLTFTRQAHCTLQHTALAGRCNYVSPYILHTTKPESVQLAKYVHQTMVCTCGGLLTPGIYFYMHRQERTTVYTAEPKDSHRRRTIHITKLRAEREIECVNVVTAVRL